MAGPGDDEGSGPDAEGGGLLPPGSSGCMGKRLPLPLAAAARVALVL